MALCRRHLATHACPVQRLFSGSPKVAVIDFVVVLSLGGRYGVKWTFRTFYVTFCGNRP